MPNNPEMTKFLYTIVKQLDLKTIDWTKVSTELGITNGHAARMRYSRFRQQMEGNTPIRRVRVPNAKRTPKQKRTKEDSKASRNIKMEDPVSLAEPMPSSSPSVANFDSTHGSNTPVIHEAVLVKPEPRDESPETPLALSTADFNSPSMSMQSISTEHAIRQTGPILAGPTNGAENIPEFTFDAHNPDPQMQQQQHLQQQRLYQMMQDHAVMMSGQNMTDGSMVMADHHQQQRDFGYLNMDIYNAMNDVSVGVGVGCQNHMISPPMVKVEERWDPSYVQ